MPELPEVQTVVDDLKGAGLCGARIARARVYWPRSISEPSPGAFCRRLRGLTVAEIRRRGKYLVFDFSEGGHLLLHLRMSGRLCLLPPGAPRSRHEHVVIILEGQGHLRLHDTRKFGRFYLMDDCEVLLGRLGPEPLDASFTAGRLAEMLRPRKRSLKPLLLDQTFIAGLGNIYVDEALWAARIHPPPGGLHPVGG